MAAAIAAAKASGSAPADTPLNRYLTPLVQLAGRVTSANAGASDAQLAELVLEENVKAQVANVVGTDVVKDNWAGKVSPLSGKVMNKISVHG